MSNKRFVLVEWAGGGMTPFVIDLLEFDEKVFAKIIFDDMMMVIDDMLSEDIWFTHVHVDDTDYELEAFKANGADMVARQFAKHLKRNDDAFSLVVCYVDEYPNYEDAWRYTIQCQTKREQ